MFAWENGVSVMKKELKDIHFVRVKKILLSEFFSESGGGVVVVAKTTKSNGEKSKFSSTKNSPELLACSKFLQNPRNSRSFVSVCCNPPSEFPPSVPFYRIPCSTSNFFFLVPSHRNHSFDFCWESISVHFPPFRPFMLSEWYTTPIERKDCQKKEKKKYGNLFSIKKP